jgi:hypothetical protein
MKKLALNRETIRSLQDSELRQVVGGIAVEVERISQQGMSNCICSGADCCSSSNFVQAQYYAGGFVQIGQQGMTG